MARSDVAQCTAWYRGPFKLYDLSTWTVFFTFRLLQIIILFRSYVASDIIFLKVWFVEKFCKILVIKHYLLRGSGHFLIVIVLRALCDINFLFFGCLIIWAILSRLLLYIWVLLQIQMLKILRIQRAIFCLISLVTSPSQTNSITSNRCLASLIDLVIRNLTIFLLILHL